MEKKIKELKKIKTDAEKLAKKIAAEIELEFQNNADDLPFAEKLAKYSGKYYSKVRPLQNKAKECARIIEFLRSK